MVRAENYSVTEITDTVLVAVVMRVAGGEARRVELSRLELEGEGKE